MRPHQRHDPPGLTVSPFIEPFMDDDVAPFWEGCARHQLLVQRCPDTQRLIFPPRPLSPYGARRPPEWVEVSGLGSIWSFVVPHPPLLPAFADIAPYNVIVVALDEDPTIRMVGNLVTGPDGAIDEIDPATIAIGQAVRVVFASAPSVPRWVYR
jgi:uncharacterized OB-fold protein